MGEVLGKASLFAAFGVFATFKAIAVKSQFMSWEPAQGIESHIELAAQIASLVFLVLLLSLTLLRFKPKETAKGSAPRISALIGTFISLSLVALPMQDLGPVVRATRHLFDSGGMVAVHLRTRMARPVVQHHGASAALGDEGSVRHRATSSLCNRRNCHDRHGPAVPFARGDCDCGCPMAVSAAPDDARRARAERGISRILRLRGIDTENYPAPILVVEKRESQPLSDRGMKPLREFMRNRAPKDTYSGEAERKPRDFTIHSGESAPTTCSFGQYCYGLAQFFCGLAQSQSHPDRLSDFHSARAPVGDASPSKDIPSWLVERRDLSVRKWVADQARYLNHHCGRRWSSPHGCPAAGAGRRRRPAVLAPDRRGHPGC